MKRRVLALTMTVVLSVLSMDITGLAAPNGPVEEICDEAVIEECGSLENGNSYEQVEAPKGVDGYDERVFISEDRIDEEAADDLPESLGDIVYSGTCGDNLTWSLDDEGCLTISGTGEMTSDPWQDELGYNRRDEIKSVTIGEGVTTIYNGAFYGCSQISEVLIPEGVVKIESGAFNECTNLERVSLPKSVVSLGKDNFGSSTNGCFRGCTKLTSAGPAAGDYSISFAWTDSIPDGAFSATSISSVVIPDGVTIIGNEAFRGCKNLSEITLPDKVNKIGNWAFSGCEALSEVILPDSVSEVGTFCFSSCDNLSHVVIPQNAVMALQTESQYCSCFSFSPKLISAGPIGSNCSIEYGWTESIPAYAFDQSRIETVILPDTISELGQGAFYYCQNLKSIEIPEKVKTIPLFAFCGCESLTDIKFPEGISVIGQQSFRGCDSLRKVYLPDSITKIEMLAFPAPQGGGEEQGIN